MDVYINRIVTRTPPHQVHQKFLEFVPRWLEDDRDRRRLARLVERAQIESRYSVLSPSPHSDRIDCEGFYRVDGFPDTQERMRKYEAEAARLAVDAVEGLAQSETVDTITHVLVTSCTGFYAPGLDLELMEHCELKPSVERLAIGFMGCFAAVNGLRTAYHIVRSQPEARVLMINLELCTLHLRRSSDWRDITAFTLFADGCAASIISSEPRGLRLRRFQSHVFSSQKNLITWHIGDQGFRMGLDPKLPQALANGLREWRGTLWPEGPTTKLDMLAVHPGGRAILDVTRDALEFSEDLMIPSRTVLLKYGNMSSPTLMFVLQHHFESSAYGENGLAMAFGPGLTVESFWFDRGSSK